MENNFEVLRIIDFLSVLASAAPVPGGGGASALTGAIGVSLGNMVGSLTVGKKTYATVENMIIEMNNRAAVIRDELVELMKKDAEDFKPLSEAYGLPKNTEEEKQYREAVMEKALSKACEAPLMIMKKCADAIDLCSDYAEHGSKIAMSDAGVGAVLCGAALKGAALNIYINTKSMTDTATAKQMNDEADELIRVYSDKAEQIYSGVRSKLSMKN